MNVPEEHPDSNLDEQEEQKMRQKEQVQKILANVRQNFGKIYVAPEFNEEDLVPVEMPDLDMADISGSDGEAVDEGDDDGEKDDIAAKPAAEETEESKSGGTKVNKAKSSREVIRELDDKIFKYKQFLEQAKSKRFSAIRFGFFNETSFFLLLYWLWCWDIEIFFTSKCLKTQLFAVLSNDLLFLGQNTKGTFWESVHRPQEERSGKSQASTEKRYRYLVSVFTCTHARSPNSCVKMHVHAVALLKSDQSSPNVATCNTPR